MEGSMHANVTSGEILSGKMDEFIKTYDESVKPVVKSIPGLQNLYVLTDEQNYKGLIIAIYKNQEDAHNANKDGHYQAAVGKLASTLVLESITRNSYSVSIRI
jgi:quinol monooxygenase YgiN